MKKRKHTEITCDICGKIILEGSDLDVWRYVIRKRKMITIAEVRSMPWDHDIEIQYDLCPECEKRLKEFIKEKR